MLYIEIISVCGKVCKLQFWTATYTDWRFAAAPQPYIQVAALLPSLNFLLRVFQRMGRLLAFFATHLMSGIFKRHVQQPHYRCCRFASRLNPT